MLFVFNMKIYNPCLVLTFFVCLMIYVKGDATDVTRKGLEAGKSIADALDKGVFPTSNLVLKAVPFLNGVVSVVKLILGLITKGSGESAEMMYLRNLSKTINTRFDDVDAQISDMKKLVQWSSIQAPYLNIALKIRAVSMVYAQIFTVPISVIETQKLLFVKNYESDYQNSGTKLFLGFVQDLGPFGGRLLDSAMSFYEYDRPKMRLLMIAMTKLLFMASQLELGYYAAKGIGDTLIDIHRRQWEDRFKQIVQRMTTVDNDVASKWKSQFPHDIDRFVLDNRRFNYSHLSDTLYSKLSTKYFWRDWLVIISDHINKHDQSQVCGGYANTKYGKDIIVTSVPKSKAAIEERKAEDLAHSLTQTCRTTSYQKRYVCGYDFKMLGSYPMTVAKYCYGTVNNKDALTIYSWFSPSVRDTCTTYGSVGIIYSSKNVAYSARRRNNTSAMDCSDGWCTDRAHTSHRYPEFERLYIYSIGLCNYKAHFFG